MQKNFRRSLLVVFVVCASSQASAALSANVGYHNPPGATAGLNLMYLGTEWGVEGGLGYVKSGENDKGHSATIVSGDLNVKYLFLGGSFRPYLQLGTGWAFATTGGSNTFGLGEVYHGGAGFFVIGAGVYTYASYNSGTYGSFLQAGLGFDI